MGAPKDRPQGSPTSREGVPVSVVDQIAALYESAARDVNALAGRALLELGEAPERRASQYRLTRAAQLTRMIEARLAQYDRRIGPMVMTETRSRMSNALAMARGQLRAIGIDPNRRVGRDGLPTNALPVGLGTFGAGVDEHAVRALAEDIATRTGTVAADEMSRGTRRHGDNAVAVFRALSDNDVLARITSDGGSAAAINRAIGRGLIQGDPKVIDRAIRDLFREPGRGGEAPEVESIRKLGNKQITVGGWTGTVRQYAATVTRTRTREATIEGRHRRLEASGIEMVQITGAVSKNPCTDFIGLVCGLHGEVEIGGRSYPALSSLPGGGPPFHPNCSKGTAAFHPELVSPHRLGEGADALDVYERGKAEGTLRAA